MPIFLLLYSLDSSLASSSTELALNSIVRYVSFGFGCKVVKD